MTELSPTATRSRRYRERKRAGITVAPVQVAPEVAEALVATGLLTEADMGDRANLGESIEILLSALADDAVEIDWDSCG